jgi:ABC-type antimicrobial peptide transport system permease subunit
MTLRTLIRRSLRHHWRAHLGVVLGAAIGSAALIGALVVGDSVKHTLKYQAVRRLPGVSVALASGDRFFSADLLQRMIRLGQQQVQPASAQAGQLTWGNGFTRYESATGLRLDASVKRADAAAQVHRINLFGYDDDVLEHIRSGQRPYDRAPPFPSDAVWLNHALAQQINAKIGDELIFRIPKPSALSRDAAISPRNDATVALRLRVIGISAKRGDPDPTWQEWFIDQVAIGEPPTDLDLHPSSGPALNAFIDIANLFDAATAFEDRCNFILASPASEMRTPNISDRYRSASVTARNQKSLKPILRLDWLKPTKTRSGFYVGPRQTLETVTPIFRSSFSLNDAQLSLARSSDGRTIELKSPRVFLDPPTARAAFATDTNAEPFLTYLVNLLQTGTKATPYSMVTAANTPWTPTDMRDDEIIVSQWLADDLQVKSGDEVTLVYFDPESGARLVEHTNVFRVRAIVPMEMPWADRTLMPDFPGIEKAESTSDWDAGFPLVHKIHDKDEEYWKQHRGTPKAFITLAAGQKMWANRFGSLTAIRFPIPTNGIALTAALSPGERENRSPASRELGASDTKSSSERSKDGRLLSPLPAGEGQGEGERSASTSRMETASVTGYKEALEKKILANLKPEELGLRFEPVREQALKAAEESQDFGGLFLGFSFFLIIAALLLMAMLFQFGLEQRTAEIGTLLALGFTLRQVRRLLLGEGVALAFIGGVIGALGGLAYARAMLHGLTTIWRDAVGASALNFHATPQTLAIGLFAATVVGAITLWLALRKFVRRSARELLVGEVEVGESKVRSLKSKVIVVGALLAAVALAGWTVVTGDTAHAGAFFGAGALVLIAGLSFVSAWLARKTNSPLTPALSPSDGERENHIQAHGDSSATGVSFTLTNLAMGGCARRRTRSLATIAMLACGSFLIVSIGVFRLDANRDASKRTSGTGGFALIGETTMPVVHDLNAGSGRDFFALSERDLEGVNFVPFRVREGDEASCLNLNRAQKPRLLGVRPELLEGRFGFTKGDGWKTLHEDGRWRMEDGNRTTNSAPSSILHRPASSAEIPAIGDANSIRWAMKKKVGDTIDYVDERGQAFKVRIVGAAANSILQGQLIIDAAEFVKRFPGESGYRMFLIDAPSNRVAEVSATLSRAMQDVGLELTPGAQRLAQFNAVQNTYLGTFQVLGGLGLLLGSVGLGVVVLRNVLERRGELAVLLAVGFRRPTLQRLLLIENGALLALGLALGIVAAGMAVLPALLSPSAQLPVASLALTLGAVLVNGALWTWAATRFALRGNLLAALRNE